MGKIVSALLLLVAIPACSDASIALSNLPAADLDALCSYMARCGEMPDKTSCEAAVNPDLAQLSAGVQAGRIKYDGKAAAACLDVLKSASCNYSALQTEPQACRDTFKGTVASGGVCYTGMDCISGDCGSGVCSGSGCCPGVCSASTSLAGQIPIGGNCSGASAGCVSGAFCSYGSTPTCQAKAAIGQVCDTSYPQEACAVGAFCLASGPNAGTCGRLAAEGQACYSGSDDHACDSMLDFCDPVALKCVPKIPVGGACSSDASCVGYATCDASGHCLAEARAGQACDDSNGPHCIGYLLCESGICAFPPAQPVCQ
jgi:hypothetical protein